VKNKLENKPIKNFNDGAGFDKTDSGLRYKIINKGSGAAMAVRKSTVVAHAEGMSDGKVLTWLYVKPIDSPGVGQVTLVGMIQLQVGDKADLKLPSHCLWQAMLVVLYRQMLR
jgi:FKBP-type peptidyl-prolyl cis-trans isomerase